MLRAVPKLRTSLNGGKDTKVLFHCKGCKVDGFSGHFFRFCKIFFFFIVVAICDVVHNGKTKMDYVNC